MATIERHTVFLFGLLLVFAAANNLPNPLAFRRFVVYNSKRKQLMVLTI